MSEKKQHYDSLVERVNDWLGQAAPAEMKSIEQWVEKAEQLLDAAAQVSVTEYQLSIDSFKRDLLGFYHSYQHDAQHSTYLANLQEGMWHHLANLTDQTQIEWAEFVADVEHDGVYKTGDVIGFGQLVCMQCRHVIDICHATEVTDCPKCGHNRFIRQAFEHNI
ncbi:hypothetical protein QWY77_07260 [Thalassotalea ponticola]|uniref:zinc ribbon-containing protein n=1 Tax=Thalassotalea ponticola TaxID=1523392 RepID=UPI0025B55F80|nr:hypothetical protein [Thalassotalea ponticola]MDN3652562.1 hypothetical protein [Thalassotalea ponticola]